MNTQYASMRYKGYTLHHSPSTITIAHEREEKVYKLPYTHHTVEDFGTKPITIQGKGTLYGDNCFKQLQELTALQSSGGAGILSVQGLGSVRALFTLLTVADGATENLINYSFVFTSDCTGVQSENLSCSKYYTVQRGESLWDIGYKLNIPIARLLEYNKNVKTCFDITAGERLVVR